MSDPYGYGGIGGGSERDRIAQAMMAVSNPPPGGLPAGGSPQQPALGGLQRPMAAQGIAPQQAPIGGLAGLDAPPAMPQQQPAAFGAMPPPAAPMGPIGGPYDPNLGLPGVPGQMRPGTGY